MAAVVCGGRWFWWCLTGSGHSGRARPPSRSAGPVPSAPSSTRRQSSKRRNNNAKEAHTFIFSLHFLLSEPYFFSFLWQVVSCLPCVDEWSNLNKVVTKQWAIFKVQYYGTHPRSLSINTGFLYRFYALFCLFIGNLNYDCTCLGLIRFRQQLYHRIKNSDYKI